jgi:hypothetical protein
VNLAATGSTQAGNNRKSPGTLVNPEPAE